MRSDQPVEDLAGAIADRLPIDWEAIRSRDSGVLALVERLKKITHVSAAYRTPIAEMPTPDLPPGTVWGSLRITEKIGEGAFGQVYRAWDLRLDREVALKVVAESPRTADAADAVEEGRLLARVRHRNVVTVFGADRVGGEAGIWMELVDGRTLEQELHTRGPLPAREIALIGRDLCRALAAVHEAGLIHRDIKAQNVVREAGGRVVLMDFGTGREPFMRDDAASAGAGTPLYLAPELFDGASGSMASDIYSVGVLLFHLATGSYPVSGRSLSEIRAAHRQSQARTDLLKTLPQPFARVISRALAHDPSARFSSAARLADALDRVANRTRRIRRRLAWAVLAVGATTSIAVAVIRPSASAVSPEVQRFILPVDGDAVRGMALSADGGRLAYIARGEGVDELIVRSLDQFSGRAIHSAGSLTQPFFSPDGNWIGVSEGTTAIAANRLVKIPTDGGAATLLCDRAAAGGARWRNDSTIVFASAGAIWTVPETGGTPVPLVTAALEPGESFAEPDVLPTGAVLATDQRREQPNRLVLLTPDGAITTIEDDASNGRYSTTGHILFVRSRTIFARPVDGRGVPSGPAVAISEAGYTSDFEISGTGTLVYRTVPKGQQTGLGATWAERETTAMTPVSFPADDYRSFGWRLSPDDSRVYVTLPHTRDNRIAGKQQSNIWVGDLKSGVLSELTFEDTIPVAWMPDSRSITIKTASGSLVRKHVDGTEPDTLLVEPQKFSFGNRGTWSPNGTALVLQRSGASTNTGIDLWAVSFASEDVVGVARPSVAAFADSRFNEFSPVFSPDGRWVAFQSDDSGRNEIYIRPFPGPGQQVQISQQGGNHPKWQGREIFYSRPDRTSQIIEAATVELQPTPRVMVTKVALRSADFAGFDVTSDGRRFLLLVGKKVQPRQLNLTLHWPGELRRPH